MGKAGSFHLKGMTSELEKETEGRGMELKEFQEKGRAKKAM